MGNPMLAHKATHEGKVAAEVISEAGRHSGTDDSLGRLYRSEVAWMGLDGNAGKSSRYRLRQSRVSWAASGRALGIDCKEGMTKSLCDKETRRILGAVIVGPNAGELISEAVLALEMGADVEDVALTMHPHPTLSETFAFAAEMLDGSITDLYIRK